MKTLTENAKKFLAKNPTKLGSQFGYDFYEHPVLGDETDIRMITPTGEYKRTGCYDMESVSDWLDSIHTFTRRK